MPISPTAPGWRSFRRLWAATTSANLADGLLLAAVPLLALSLTRDPLLIAALSAAQYVPWLVFSLPAGVLADLHDRGRLMRLANLTRTGALAVLAGLVAADLLTVPVLFGTALVMGLAETLCDNTSSAMVPSLVADRDLDQANARLQVTYPLANSFVGPPVGGVLFGVAAAAPLLLGAGGYAAAALLLLALPPVPTARTDEPDTPRRGLVGPMREGWSTFRASSPLVSLCVLAAVGNAVSAAAYALVALYLVEDLAAPASTFGLVLAGGAVGAVLGGAVAGRIAVACPIGALLIGTTFVSGLAVAALALTHGPLALSAAMAADGFVVVVQSVVLISTRARLTPPSMMGRVTAVFRSFSMGALVLGGLAGGALASATSVPVVFVTGGTVLVALALVMSSRLRTRTLEAGFRPLNR